MSSTTRIHCINCGYINIPNLPPPFYHATTCSICEGCGLNQHDNPYDLIINKRHIKCIPCKGCGINDGKRMHSYDGDYYHETCAICEICNLDIIQSNEFIIIAAGKKIHKTCLICQRCSKTENDISGKVYVYDDGTWHSECWNESHGLNVILNDLKDTK
jgi:hypothetical protein